MFGMDKYTTYKIKYKFKNISTFK